MTLSEIKMYLSTIQWPEGFYFTPRLHDNGKLEIILYRDNLAAMGEKELTAITNKVAAAMRYFYAQGQVAYVEAQHHAPR